MTMLQISPVQSKLISIFCVLVLEMYFDGSGHVIEDTNTLISLVINYLINW